MNYLFTSKRLGFRPWTKEDIVEMNKLSSNPDVMRFFPGIETLETTKKVFEIMDKVFCEKGYCYFIVELLESKNIIGFIGIYDQTYESEFTPAIDIGWRLHKHFWGKGYAKEGAMRCIEYAFEILKIPELIAVAPEINLPSIKVMEKIGMNKVGEFIHPSLLHYEKIKKCVCYKVSSSN